MARESSDSGQPMNVALRSIAVSGLMLLAGCQSFRTAEGTPDPALRIEFTRPARIYEPGDAIFAMVNDTPRVMWLAGQSADEPAYEMKPMIQRPTGTNSPTSRTTQRFPLSPGETRYFEVETRGTTAPVSIGITFYPSFTATEGEPVWSAPASVPVKRRQLN